MNIKKSNKIPINRRKLVQIFTTSKGDGGLVKHIIISPN